MDNTPNYNFDIEIQKKFLSLFVFDYNWATLVGKDVLKPEYFDNIILKNICNWILKYQSKYKTMVTKDILTNEALEYTQKTSKSTEEYYLYTDTIEEIFTLNDGENLEYYKDKVVAFARRASYYDALVNAKDIFLKSDNYEEAIAMFKQAINIGGDVDLGLDLQDSRFNFLDIIGETYSLENIVKTGIAGWDDALGGGFVKDNLHLVCAKPGGGKQIATTTPVLTPDGWKKAGEIKVGDYLISRKGTPTKVLGVFPQGISNNYKITFNDKSTTNCGREHLWSVYDTKLPKSNQLQTLSLGQILEKGLYKDNLEKYKLSGKKPINRWKLPLVEPIQFTEKQYSISPYNMGVLLGGGCLNTESIKLPYPTEFIPEEYKFGSVEQRIELLRGLMDTNGISGKNCKIRYTTISQQLAEDIVELVQSLGGLAYIKLKTRKSYVNHNFKNETYYNVIIKININPFHIADKSVNWYPTKFSKYITNVEQQEDTDSVCFKVDNEEELFVIEHYIVTHNSKTIAFLSKQALLQRKKVLSITLELSEPETLANLMNSITGLTLTDLLKTENKQEYDVKIENFCQKYAPNYRVKFYKPATVSCDTINNYIMQLINKTTAEGNPFKPDIIFIDYLDKLLPTSSRNGKNLSLYEEIGGVADDCKNLAITYGCPVVSASQLGRYSWDLKDDQVVSMASIAESARKVHLAHSITTFNSNPAELDLGLVRLFTAKSRSGRPGKVIWCKNDLGRCNMAEIEPWDPKGCYSSAGSIACNVKSGDK